MAVVSISYLLESGVHFGHQTKRWNPKMKEYIFTSRDNIYIIDLQKTAQKIEEAYQALKEITKNEGKVLFVGTKKQAQEAIKDEALRSKMFYVNERWLGGTLTNFKTIRERIYRLDEIEKMEKEGKFELLPKKEVIKIKKEYAKLLKNLSGIREMKKIPEAMIVVDPSEEATALKEAKILKIPTFGIVDTNCDPDSVDYPIPANDDAIRALKLVLSVLNNAICESYSLPLIDYITEEDKKGFKKEEVKEEVEMPKVKIKSKEEKEEPKKEIKVTKEEPKKEIKVTKETKKEPKVELSNLKVNELKEIAKEKKVKNYSKMKKEELIKALK